MSWTNFREFFLIFLRISIFTTNLKIWNSENFASLKLVVVTQHVWYTCFVLFSKCFCLIKKPWFNGSTFLFLFYPRFSGICLKHSVNHSNIRAFKYNREFQLLQKTLKEYFCKPQEYFFRLEVVWKFGFTLIQTTDSKLFILLKLLSKIKANHWQYFLF